MYVKEHALSTILNTRRKENEYSKLQMDIEDAKTWLQDVKLFVNKMLRSRINLCTLTDFIDVVNAVQMFFYSNYIQPSKTNTVMMFQWPEWYRTELLHAITHIQRGMAVVMSELGAYVQLASEAVLSDDEITTDEIRKQLKDRQTECGAFGKWYREQYVDNKWDVCEICTKPNLKESTLLQTYNDIIKSDPQTNIKLIRKATDSLSSLPFSDAVMKPYIEKWLPEKLRKFKQSPKQAHLGNPLPASLPQKFQTASASSHRRSFPTSISFHSAAAAQSH